MPAPNGCIRFALLPRALDGSAPIFSSSLSEPFPPVLAAALERLAV